MLRFRLFGIPFEVAPTFWIFSAILGGNAAQGPDALLLLAVWVACVFVSIVVHELGHALMARHYGAQPSVQMYALGGVTQPGQGFTRGQNLLVVLCGPAAGFGLFLLTMGFTFAFPPPSFHGHVVPPAILARYEAVSDLLFINFVWTLFNLLPILPLDGGLILRNVLGPRLENTARIIGAVCAVACAGGALYLRQAYMAFFLGVLAVQNFHGVSASPGRPDGPSVQ